MGSDKSYTGKDVARDHHYVFHIMTRTSTGQIFVLLR